MVYKSSQRSGGGGGGTVTSIGITGNDGIDVSGSPVTGAGNITLDLGDITPTSLTTNNVTITGGTITGMPSPTGGSDVANKSYVDATTAGLSPKNSVRVGTTGALTVTYSNGASGVGATLTNAGAQAAIAIDSVTLALNDRVLVKNQAAPAQNGIYTVTDLGSVSTNWVMTRATDYDTSSEVSAGSYTIITEGTVNTGTLWIETGVGPFTIGTTAITFTELMVASQSITLTGAITGTGAGTIATSLGSFTSAQLATALTDETGTGVAVFNASPTFTGTVTAAAITMTGVLTNSQNAAASAPAVSLTGTTFSGTGTTSTPLFYINAGAAPSSWSTSGTQFGINAASGFAGVLMDFHVNGGASVFNVTAGGGISGATLLTTGNITTGGNFRSTANAGVSSSPLLLSGTLQASGTGTTTFPQFLQEATGTTAVTTWSTAGTYHGINAASGFTGSFLDFHVNGAASVFSVSNAGAIIAASSITSGATIQAAPASQLRIGATTIFTAPAAATWQLGAAAAASPVAQTIQAQSVVTGTADTAGQNWTFKASGGTGTGAGGSFIFQVAPAGSAGSTPNSFVTALTIDSTRLFTFADAANMAFNTTTGTKIGTATSQKIGFFNATPVVQQTGDLITALSNLGLVVTGTIAGSALTSATLGSGVGFSATSYSGGTISSGTYTPATTNGNFQHITNGGAFTLAPPSTVCTIIVEVLNNGSAGTITTSSFTKVTGDSLTTTNGSKFQCFITKTQNYSSLNVVALQ